MDSEVRLLLDRAENELLAAKALYKISGDNNIKSNLALPERTTFYSSVIGHSYYSIFYSVKAALISIGIRINAPFVHNKAYDLFKKYFVNSGKLDKHILEVYETMLIRAEDLLSIMKVEKTKRGTFTYKTLPQANKDPAQESINNANTFVSHIKSMLSR